MPLRRVVGLALLLSPLATGQLTDLQPGPNFPLSAAPLGSDHVDNIASGDLDGDGDLDLVFANGGNSGNEQNRIFINQGGLQGGVQGDFVDETALRFAALAVDLSRDVELVDYDLDGDLDVFIANSSPGPFFGQPSRFWTNQGGLQGGATGFFVEESDQRWGQLISVPTLDQVTQADVGPFAEWSCDCDFADFDDDGAPDLFLSSYGPNLLGTRDSRIFLNDGGGVFNELWPWADPGADVRLHTLDVELADFDGDFDIDVAISSRDSQARIFANNLYAPLGSSPFTDVTQSALLDTGATMANNNNYAFETGDLDGDDDFDIWAVNYVTSSEYVLENTSEAGAIRFERAQWVLGQTGAIDVDADLLDYDGDGDLDATTANFVGVNPLFLSGLAQGVAPGPGLFHRTGTTAGGSAAPWPEFPAVGNQNISWDSHVADVDGDGDPDVLVGNHGSEPTRLMLNSLGVPDVHAPRVVVVSPLGQPVPLQATVIHARLTDNAPWYVVDATATTLLYRVDLGPELEVPMRPQGGQQFRAVLPAEIAGAIRYRVRAVDPGGNTAVSATQAFLKGSPAWDDLGDTLAGDSHAWLLGTGSLSGGTSGALLLGGAEAFAPISVLVSIASTPTPFKGGTLHPVPVSFQVDLLTDGEGAVTLPFDWPVGLPAGVSVWFQAALHDTGAVQDVGLSNALRGTTP